ncbi:MAG: hypothetical protein ACP5I4_00065 [Oceanipulchritudo sp.]
MRGPKVAQYESELSDLEREWKTIQTNIERSTGLEGDIGVLEEGLGKIRGRLMNVDQVALNYEFFYELERQAGVTVTQFTQGVASEGENLPIGRDNLLHFSVIPYNIVMEGTLQQVLRFLDLLDRQEFIIRTDLLNVARQGVGESVPDKLKARLRCHVLAEKNE